MKSMRCASDSIPCSCSDVVINTLRRPYGSGLNTHAQSPSSYYVMNDLKITRILIFSPHEAMGCVMIHSPRRNVTRLTSEWGMLQSNNHAANSCYRSTKGDYSGPFSPFVDVPLPLCQPLKAIRLEVNCYKPAMRDTLHPQFQTSRLQCFL